MPPITRSSTKKANTASALGPKSVPSIAKISKKKPGRPKKAKAAAVGATLVTSPPILSKKLVHTKSSGADSAGANLASTAPKVPKNEPKGKFSAVSMEPVVRIEFTDKQRAWLFKHRHEHFKPADDATLREYNTFYRQAWNDFSDAFPDNNIAPNLSWSTDPSDLFKSYQFGRQVVAATRHEMWFTRNES